MSDIAAHREALLAAKNAVLRAWSAFHHLEIPERDTLAAAAVLALRDVAEPSDRKLNVEHVTYNIGTVDSLDRNLRGCLASHRDALLDARAKFYPDAPTEGRDV